MGGEAPSGVRTGQRREARAARTLNLSNEKSFAHQAWLVGLNQSTHALDPDQHQPSKSVLPSGCLQRMSSALASE